MSVLEHQVVGFPDLFRGAQEREDGVCESWFGEVGNYAIGRVFDGCPKLGSMGGELVELGTPGGLHGVGCGVGLFYWCWMSVMASNGFVTHESSV